MPPKKRQKSMAKHSIFPINQFPREILTEIFWNCLPEQNPEVGLNGPVQMLKRAAPLLVSSICSSWRELALAMPKLWTTVGIVIRNPNMDPSATAHVVNAWLERSGTLPLKLYLGQLSLLYDWDVPLSETNNTGLAQSILSAFYSHSSRWQDVNLSLYESSSLSLPRLDTPLLRTFKLSGPWEGALRFPFGTIPHLTELVWPFPIDPSKYTQIPWSQISRLHISDRMSLFSVSEMIHLCPQLEEFWVGCPGFDEVANLPREPKVEHGRLRLLELLGYEEISPLLHSLTLPALEHLTCSTQNDEDMPVIPTNLHESLLEFLTRSNCKLKKLKLGDSQLSSDGLLECLEHGASDTLQELTLEEWPRLTDDILHRLTHPPPPTAPRILLPKLTHLTLVYCLDASPGMLAEMVYSRYHRETDEVEKLKVLVLEVEDLDLDDESTIEDLDADGLDTSIFIRSRPVSD